MLSNPYSVLMLTISVLLIFGALYIHKVRQSSDTQETKRTVNTSSDEFEHKSDNKAEGRVILIIEVIFWSLILGSAYFSISNP